MNDLYYTTWEIISGHIYENVIGYAYGVGCVMILLALVLSSRLYTRTI